MAASIDFTDASGAATLTTISAHGRFNNWVPDPRPVDVAARSIGTGEVSTTEHRERAAVTFEVPFLQTSLDIATRLMKHLWRGGVVTVNTDDATAQSFSSMAIATDGGQRVRPTLTRTDPQLIDYQLTLSLEYIGTGAMPDLSIVY